ncbi:hypothetical protein pb186bvf_006742 [Paramecium bursaria]
MSQKQLKQDQIIPAIYQQGLIIDEVTAKQETPFEYHMNQRLNEIYKCISKVNPNPQLYIEEFYKYHCSFLLSGDQIAKYFKDSNNNFRIIELHKQKLLGIYDKKVCDILEACKKQCNNNDANRKYQEIQEFILINKQNNKKIVKTHQELMDNWLTFSDYEEPSQDEIKDFERRLEAQSVYISEDQKQKANVSSSWEKTMQQKMKKYLTRAKQ